MPYNYDKLIGRIVERYGTQYRFAQAMRISEHSLSMKLNSKTPWKQKEIEIACELLKIPRKAIPEYFFALYVQ